MKIRNQEIHVLYTPQELEILHQKMAEAGVRNRSAYVRKMSLDGYVVHLDMSDIREMITLLRRCSNNLNQIAKNANATGSIYASDLSEVQARQDEIWENTREILARLSSI